MKNITLILILAGAVTVGCSSKEVKEEKLNTIAADTGTSTVSQEAHMIANENEAPFVAELAFTKGSANLSNSSKEKLKQTLVSARNSGEVEEVKVITWADQEYPSVHTKELPKSQVDLVVRRNNEIKKYIQQVQKKAAIKVYSMAERPSSLSELFNTNNSRIKKSLEIAGIPNTDTAVKTPSKAQKSIVMVILK